MWFYGDGLMEVQRVCRPEGEVLLLEHVLSANRLLAWIMNITKPLVVRVVGANINRETIENVRDSGLVERNVTGQAIVIRVYLIKPPFKHSPRGYHLSYIR
jgi:hypothetical protein